MAGMREGPSRFDTSEGGYAHAVPADRRAELTIEPLTISPQSLIAARGRVQGIGANGLKLELWFSEQRRPRALRGAAPFAFHLIATSRARSR